MTASTTPSRRGSTSAAACASSTRSRSKRRSATSATTSPTRCGRSSRRSSSSTPATGASRARSSAKLDEKVHVAEPESRGHPPQVHGQGRQGQDRRPLHKKFLGELSRVAGPGRRRGHLQDPRGGRVADPRARGRAGQGHRLPPRRRARPARGRRDDARRGHHRRGARASDEQSFRRHQGDHPPDGAPRVQDGRRRRERTFFGRDQGRRPARGRGHRASTRRTRPDGPDGKHASRPTHFARMSCQPPKYRRVDARLPRRASRRGRRRSTSPTTTQIGFEPVTEHDRRDRAAAVRAGRLAHALPLRARRASRATTSPTPAVRPGPAAGASASTTSR